MKNWTFNAHWLLLLTVGLILSCAPATEVAEIDEPAPLFAVAQLQPTEGSEVTGTVTFEELPDGRVKVSAHVTGLTPGLRGFHIHEFGDCSAPDSSSAGNHFNPAGVEHGGPDDDVKHAGDLGNLEVGEDGMAHKEMTVDFISLMEGDRAIVGRSVIVHADPDDLASQPTGAAGARLACGVIEMSSAAAREGS